MVIQRLCCPSFRWMVWSPMLMLALRSSGLHATLNGTSIVSGARRPTSVAYAVLRLKASRTRRPPWRVNPTSPGGTSEASHVYPVPQPPPQSGRGVPETTVPPDTGSGGNVPGTNSSRLGTPASPSSVQNAVPLRTGAYVGPSRQTRPIQRADGLRARVAACGAPVAGSGAMASKIPCAPGLVPVATDAHAEADSAPGVDVTRTRPEPRANSARWGSRPSAIKRLRIACIEPVDRQQHELPGWRGRRATGRGHQQHCHEAQARHAAHLNPTVDLSGQSSCSMVRRKRARRGVVRADCILNSSELRGLYWRECGSWASTMAHAAWGWR